MGNDYKEWWYIKCIEVCDLFPDFQTFTHGDEQSN